MVILNSLQINARTGGCRNAKTAPASCCGNRGGSFALFVLFQALTQLLAGVLDSSLGGCQNYRAFLASFVLCDYPQSHSLFSNPPWIRGPTKNVTKALGSCSLIISCSSPISYLFTAQKSIFLGWLVYAPYPFQKVTPRPIFCRISVCTVETSVNIRAATLMFWS